MAKPRVKVSHDGQFVANYEGAGVVHQGLRDWYAPTADADSALEGDRDVLIDRSYDVYRNNAIARAAIDSLVNGIVGSGLRLQSTIDSDVLDITPTQAEEIEEQLEYDFDLWASSVESDLTRRENFYQSQRTIERDAKLGGDAFCLFPYLKRKASPWGLKFQLVDGQRVSNPNRGINTSKLTFGIEKDRYGAAKRVHIQTSHPGSKFFEDNWKWDAREIYGKRTGRKNVLHYFMPERIGQTRGAPTLAPVLALLKEAGTYLESEVRSAVVSSYFTAFLLKESGGGPGPALPQGKLAGGASLGPNEIAMGSASIVELPSWVKEIAFADPKRPNANAAEFIHFMMELIGAATGLPLEIILKKFQSSYSASRAAKLEAGSTYTAGRVNLANGYCQPTYSSFVDEGVAAGRYKLPGYEDPYKRLAYLGSEWIGPTLGQIDELKAWQAQKLAKEIGGKSMNRITREMTGEPYKAVKKQIDKEQNHGTSTDTDGDNAGTQGQVSEEPAGAVG